MMTDLAWTVSPSSKLTWCKPATDDRETARAACLMRAPNFCACNSARAASSSPDRPAGKPRRFSIRDDVPAWPPSAVSSARIVAGLVSHDHAQLRDGHSQNPPGRGGHRGQVGTLPGEHADLAQELRPAIPGDARGAGPAIPLDDLGGAIQHHDQ